MNDKEWQAQLHALPDDDLDFLGDLILAGINHVKPRKLFKTPLPQLMVDIGRECQYRLNLSLAELQAQYRKRSLPLAPRTPS